MKSLRESARHMGRWVESLTGQNGIHLVDHSGLNEESRISPNTLVSIMVQAEKDRRLRPYLKRIALRNEAGKADKNHPIQVDAKTGTLNFVSSLSGYITTNNGRDLAFAILTANLDRRRSIPPEKRDRPPGARAWKKRSEQLQQQLIKRWDTLYGA